MARGRELKVYLTSDVSRFTKGLRKGESSIRRFGRIAAVGLGAAAAGAIAVGTEAVQAAMQQEKANAKLRKSLENLGMGDQTDAVLENIDALQKQTGISEDDLIPAFSKLVGVTKDSKGAFDLLRAAMDTAVATGKPLESVTSAIARAAGGSAGALSRLVPELDKTALKGADAEDVMRLLNKRFGGTAQANADTMAGTMDRFGIHLGEVNEALGEGIITGFMEKVGGVDGDNALANMEGMEDNARLVGEALGNLGANSMTWAGDFIAGLEAISLAVDTWSLNVTRRINDTMDFIGMISDEEGQRRSDVVDQMLLDRNAQARLAVTGSPLAPQSGPNGGNFGPNPYSTYRPMRTAQRYRDASGTADARSAQRGARTRQNP